MLRSERLVDVVGGLAAAVHDDDFGVALGALAELRTVLDDVEHELVAVARRRQRTWAEIAYWGGLNSRQAAHARARRLLSVRPPL